MTKAMYNANYRAKHRLKIRYLADAYAMTDRGKERREAARIRYRERNKAKRSIIIDCEMLYSGNVLKPWPEIKNKVPKSVLNAEKRDVLC